MKIATLVSVLALVIAAPALAKEPHKKHEAHDHAHKKDCGHKSEDHKGHTDYEHDGHHHKTHQGHVDECTGPETEKTAEKAPEPKAE